MSSRTMQESFMRKEENELHVLAEISQGMMGSFYKKEDGSICMPHVSPNILDLFGLNPEDMQKDALPFLALTHPDDAQRVNDSIEKSANSLTLWHEEYRIIHPAKGIRWMESHTMPKPHPDGGVIWYGYVHDITDRKVSELALKEKTNHYDNILDNSVDIISLVEVNKNGRFIHREVNNACLEAAGLGREDIVDRYVDELENVSFREILIDKYSSCLNAGKKTDYIAEYSFPKGKVVLHSILTPIVNTYGEASQILEIARYITEKNSEKKLLKQKKFQESLLHGMAKIGLNLSVIENGKYIYTNSYETAKEYGYNPDKIHEEKPDLLTTIHPDDKEKVMRMYQKRLAGEDVPNNYTVRILRKNGDVEEHELSVVLVPNTDPVQTIVVGKDITELKKIERELIKQKNFQDTLLKGVAEANLGIHVLENGKYIYTNNTALAQTYFGEVITNDNPDFIESVHPDDREKIADIYKKSLTGEQVSTTYNINLLTKKGETREHEVAAVVIPNTDPMQLILVNKDITERKNIEKRIEFMAHHDILTSLPNRLLAKDRAKQIFARAKRLNKKAAVLFVDLDGFKTVNDSLGHSVGDEVIKKVAKRLQSSIRESDTLSRQGGDEFIVILPDLEDVNEAKEKSEELLEQLKVPFQINHHSISLSASIGISLFPDQGDSFESLLQNADAAMYKAKETGKNDYCIFNDQMKHNLLGNLKIQNDLKSAIKDEEFILHYQPQVDISTNQITGVEALIRWKHPLLGMIPPMDFIPIAESTGLIVPIGEWVILEACTQAALWHKQGKKISVAVNISALQFKRGNLLNVVKKALKDSGLDPEYLELELTESILIHDTENVLQAVGEIKALGVQLSIDDFGTGYSSLAYLKKFAVDKLKIDQSFVKEILVDKEDASIVKTIIQVANSFNLKSIAEGVESQEVVDLVKSFGCNAVQGYHFSKPLSSKAFEEFYETVMLSIAK